MSLTQSVFEFEQGHAVQHRPERTAGVDEAGRGPLAGAVYAAAVILPKHYELPGLTDSKKLTERRREQLFDAIQQQSVAYAIHAVSAADIDAMNIFQATMHAMKSAAEALETVPEFVYVDGNRCPEWSYPSAALVKGDSRLGCIAAASVLAKVARDREMLALDAQYPAYGFARHKGYPTAVHLAALIEHGPCPAHRSSYAPVARAIERFQNQK
ncbi:MAG: ribonuclease HII [Pseudohongiella nitratireducens]|nr:ribonuclease HII [Pseudohongiella nitratireducens]MDF1623543.1 ribonuclease HII [Pseudohongiella nitratireducens]